MHRSVWDLPTIIPPIIFFFPFIANNTEVDRLPPLQNAIAVKYRSRTNRTNQRQDMSDLIDENHYEDVEGPSVTFCSRPNNNNSSSNGVGGGQRPTTVVGQGKMENRVQKHEPRGKWNIFGRCRYVISCVSIASRDLYSTVSPSSNRTRGLHDEGILIVGSNWRRCAVGTT